MIKFLIGLIFLLTILVHPVSAQVVINEFYSQGSSSKDPDWVEIYNTSNEAIDLTSYTLSDDPTSGNPEKTFSCILAAHGFTTVDWFNKLNNGGDIIHLKNNNTTINTIAYNSEGDLEITAENKYASRNPDGGDWQVSHSHTKNNPNDGSEKSSEAICTTPTPIPEDTPVPEDTPTPEPTETPAPTIEPAEGEDCDGGCPLTDTIEEEVVTTSLADFPKQLQGPDKPLGPEKILGAQHEPEQEDEPDKNSKSKSSKLIPTLLITIGFGLISYPIWQEIKKRRRIENPFKRKRP